MNEVMFEYNELSQLTKMWQEHGDAVDGSSYVVEHEYDLSLHGVTNGNYSRLETLKYFWGGDLGLVYGTGGTSSQRVGRLQSLTLSDLPYYSTLAGYSYLGLADPVVVDYTNIDVQLDRTADASGNRNYSSNTNNAGAYPAYDRFGRLVRHMWLDGIFDTGTGSNASNPPIHSTIRQFDKAGTVLTRFDEKRRGHTPHSEEEFDHDDLLRLVKMWRGERASGTTNDFSTTSGFTFDSSSRQWNLDLLGNWTMLQSNATTGGSFDEEDRTHNTTNELTSIDPDGAGTGASALALDYDDAGNLRHRYTSSEDAYRYTHDAWGRLVKVEFVEHVGNVGGTEAAKTRAEFEYNGLHFRIVTRTDTSTSPDGTMDEERLMYYSAAWQLSEEDIDDTFSGTHSTDRLMQYIWGPRYIDDIIMRRENRNLTNDSPTVTYDYNRYYVTDEQFSVVAILNAAGKLMERVTYDPYGTPCHHWPADYDGDRAITSGELSNLYLLAGMQWVVPDPTTINETGYIPDADINRDGVIDSTDYGIANAVGPRAALAEGVLTIPFGVASGANPEANIVGFSSYLYHQQMGEYHVRFRVYNTHLGRWIERDPLQYVDGMSLYGYGFGAPLTGMDPYGLWWGGDAWDWFTYRVIQGNNLLHGWIADKVVTPVLGQDILVNTHPAVLYGGGVVVSIAGGVLIYFGGVFIASEIGHLMLSNGTYAAMVRAIGTNAGGLARFRWLIANGHAAEMLTYWLAHPLAFMRFIGRTWPPTKGAIIGGPVLAYLLYLWTKYVWNQSAGSNQNTPRPAPAAAPAPTATNPSGENSGGSPGSGGGHGNGCFNM